MKHGVHYPALSGHSNGPVERATFHPVPHTHIDDETRSWILAISTDFTIFHALRPGHPLQSNRKAPREGLLHGNPSVTDQPGPLVAHGGFEPPISSLRGRCPRPLDECATRA